jgi:hypothetical protein
MVGLNYKSLGETNGSVSIYLKIVYDSQTSYIKRGNGRIKTVLN